MIVIGLTGSIGMGKTTTAGLFAEEGIPVSDADADVHALYAKGGAGVDAVAKAFPGTVKHGAVDREALAAQVLDDPAALKRLEAIVHPLVRRAREMKLQRAMEDGADLFVLDVPLLFETGSEKSVDVVVVASAPENVQRARVLQRPGMTEEKLESVLSRQMPDAEKRRRADFVVDTSRGIEDARQQVRDIIARLRGRAAKKND